MSFAGKGAPEELRRLPEPAVPPCTQEEVWLLIPDIPEVSQGWLP